MRGKTKRKTLYKSSCNLTGTPENIWMKHENKQVCWKRPCRGGVVACLNFKRSRVGALSMFHVAVTVAVGNLKKGCRLWRFHFKCCRYFLGHVACRNLPWQSLLEACLNFNK